MENVLTESEITELIEDVVKSEGIINPKHKTSDGYKKGDGFMSYWTMVEIRGENKTLNLAVKSAPRKEDTRKLLSTRKCFLREIYFFEKYLPLLRTVSDVEYMPKCYKTVALENREVLCFEDLKSLGYQLADCKLPMEETQILSVLDAYAKLHASSYALELFKQEEFRAVTAGFDEVFGADVMVNFNKTVAANIDAIITILRKDTGLCRALEAFKNSLSDFSEILTQSKNNHSVIMHGDCWCNNIMFKYQKDSNPKTVERVKLIDFQITGVANPLLDIANVLFLSCDTNELNKIDEYLLYYYKSLCENLCKLNCIPEEIYPSRKFNADWKVYGKYGLLMASTEFYVMQRDDDEKVCIDNLDQENLASLMTGNVRNKRAADERLCKLAKYMYRHGFIE